MKFMQAISCGANAITEPRDSAHPYNSFNSLLKGEAYLWMEETCKYPDIYKQVSSSTAFGRNVDNLEITSVPLGHTNVKKAYPTGWLTAVASGKGTDPRVAVAWDVFRSEYDSTEIGKNEMKADDQAFADGLLTGEICCEVGSFGTSGTTTLSLTESGLVPKILNGGDVTRSIAEVKAKMTDCIKQSTK